MIFQLEDDNSRVAVASHVAPGETSDAALTVFKKGVSARGVPQRLLTDNGLALNPSRRGVRGQLVTYAESLGVEMITGKPYKPTTQGKNERFHQTLFRWLDRQPLAADIEQLQALVDEFDMIYNTQRPHQGLPGRVTPQEAWDRTLVAEAPRPTPPEAGRRTRKEIYVEGEAVRRVGRNSTVTVIGTSFVIGRAWIGEEIAAVWDEEVISFFTQTGDLMISYPKPSRGTRNVSRKYALEIGVAKSQKSPMS